MNQIVCVGMPRIAIYLLKECPLNCHLISGHFSAQTLALFLTVEEAEVQVGYTGKEQFKIYCCLTLKKSFSYTKEESARDKDNTVPRDVFLILTNYLRHHPNNQRG